MIRRGLAALALLFATPLPALAADAETVVLLHGLARSADSMQPLVDALAAAGYRVVNLDYPSTSKTIEALVTEDLAPALAPHVGSTSKLHFVTHSMGGILVRQYLAQNRPDNLGRVVMLAPPNGGSELVDELGALSAFDWFNGPAGRELGTGVDSVPNRLGPADFPLGIIAGNRSFNPLYSKIIPGDDDGKVSVARAQLAGMADFLVLPHTHTWIMRATDVQQQVVAFLRDGHFEH